MSRPKGYAPWSPGVEVQATLAQVQDVLDEYRNYLPMTARQIFYRMVGSYGYEKTERAYKRLAGYLVRARRARMIDFSSIRDDGTKSGGSTGYYSSAKEFLDSLRDSADAYSRVLMAGQDVHVEIWCEAEGMLPQLVRVADDYGIRAFATGGFSSVTVTHEIGGRAAYYHNRGQRMHLLHIGDFDPSGVSLYEAMTEDASRFAMARGARPVVAHRVALTGEQVAEHGLPTAPPKGSDTRSATWYGETAQAEAMPPDLLAQTLHEAIRDVVDVDLIDDIKAEEEQEREQVREKLESLGWDD